jgi:hypothetical protein
METATLNNHAMVETIEAHAIVVNPMDAAPAIFKAGLNRRRDNRKTLMEWIRSALVEGRDYGSIIIKGAQSKPSLFKPGAEKIAGMLGLIPRFPNLPQYEQAVLDGTVITQIILRCVLENQSGNIIGEGVGARNVETQDNGDLNKALKMASKSAMIDAMLRTAGISEVFTQDVEDMSVSVSVETTSLQDGRSKTSYAYANSEQFASEKQVDAVRGLLRNPKVTSEEKQRINEYSASGLTKVKAKELLDYFYGRSEFVNGSWVKGSTGELDQR